MPGVDVRFRRPDGGLDPSSGPIEVLSPAMPSGYRHRPVEQAANFVGWYRTGGLGRLDDEGFLHVLGRAVDCEEVDGVVVIPVGLQDTLCQTDQVRYAVVVVDRGRRRPIDGLDAPGAPAAVAASRPVVASRGPARSVV